MSGVTVAIMVICGIAIFMWALYMPHMQNRFFVQSGKRERLVLISGWTGAMKVRGPGIWYEWLHWREFARVDTDREELEIVDEVVKCNDGVELRIKVRVDTLAGRPYAEEDGFYNGVWKRKGELLVDNLEDDNHVQDDIIIQTVTRIDYESRETRIRQYVSKALEYILGQYTAHELTKPGEANPEAPKGSGQHVSDAKAFYTVLNNEVEHMLNAELSFVGINVTGFGITGISAKSEKGQAAIEQSFITNRETDAALEAARRDRASGTATPITTREALVIGEDDFGKVALAEAGRDAAKSIGNAIERGLRNFGRGNQN